MPEINFVLPHWLYWSGLVLFPLIAMWLFRRLPSRAYQPVSLSLAYFLLVTAGFVGVHRLYLKSTWSLVFIALFISVLFVNQELRDSRNAMSNANNRIMVTEFELERAEEALQQDDPEPQIIKQRIQAQKNLEAAQQNFIRVSKHSEDWHKISASLGWALLLLLLIDAFLLPGLVRRRNEHEKLPPDPDFVCPVVEVEHDDRREPLLFTRIISRLNGLSGEFVAYWSVIAVLVYYYEVLSRYVFNSPTNWAHESMFLMFGMQYLLAGGYVLREGAHVRVDVIYNYFSNRAKGIVDLFTSIFFFIFVITLLFTGWTFFNDSYQVSEVSFTEWAIQYWPIKFALPLGAALLLLQGIAQLCKDIAVVINPDAIKLDTKVRPEG